MALYSFCVRKKGNTGYFKGNFKHDLVFLDYFATRFNNKEELLKFLGVDPKVYDDIKICYQNNREMKLLPIYFDSRDLEEIVSNMIDFKSINELNDLLKITIAYHDKNTFEVKKIVPKNYITIDIIKRIFYSDRPYLAFDAKLLHAKAIEYWEERKEILLEREMLSGYLNIRKCYEYLRRNDYITPNKRAKRVPDITMQEIVNDLIYERFNSNDLNDYQNNLIARVNDGDETSYEELMGNSIEEIENLKPYVKK